MKKYSEEFFKDAEKTTNGFLMKTLGYLILTTAFGYKTIRNFGSYAFDKGVMEACKIENLNRE